MSMTRIIRIAVVTTIFAVPAAAPAQGSGPAVGRAAAGDVAGQGAQDTACTYTTCSLRLERGRLLQGVRGQEVGRVGAFGTGLEVLETGPEAAVAHLGRYRSSARRGTFYWLVGLAGFYAVPYAMDRDLASFDDAGAAGLAAAFTVGGFAVARGTRHTRAAENSIQRSVWAFNRPFTDDRRGAPVPAVELNGAGWDYAPLILGVAGGLIGAASDDADHGNAIAGSWIGAGAGVVVAALQMLIADDP
ncbi:MAG: hypothetical protein ACOCUW_04920 [Gemmatimonadota bacterium]